MTEPQSQPVPRATEPPLGSSESAPSTSLAGTGGSLVGLGLVLGVLVLAALAWFLLAPAPELDTRRYINLFKNRQFETAEPELRAHLRRSSRDPRAAFLLGQLILEETETPAGINPTDRTAEALELMTSCEDAPGLESLTTPATLLYYRGKALYQLNRWEAAETAWLEAIKRDARVPEANWSLLDLYYLENRRREARDLALRLFPTEPDPRDQAQLLLELIREDAIHPDSGSIVKLMGPVVAAEPEAVSVRQALGLALVRSSQIDEGIAVLEKLASEHPNDPRAWDGWLEALDLAGRLDLFRPAYDRVPEALRMTPVMARHRGLAFQIDEDWKKAAESYKEAQSFDPTDFGLLVRLARAQKFADPDQARLLDDQVTAWREASTALLDLYDEANGTRTLGVAPHTDLCERLASSRIAMGRPDEAALWRQIGRGVTGTGRPVPKLSQGLSFSQNSHILTEANRP